MIDMHYDLLTIAYVCCYASHSNSINPCNRPRKLRDEQLKQIKEVGGLVGIFSNRNFIVPQERKNICSEQEKRMTFVEYTKHISSIIGIENVCLATDDMDFCKEVRSRIWQSSNLFLSKLKKVFSRRFANNI